MCFLKKLVKKITVQWCMVQCLNNIRSTSVDLDFFFEISNICGMDEVTLHLGKKEFT